ncbi:MAG: hypothetical protein IBX66_02895 [Lutibacter sp.]|nr:hypothetical protein [Lutibacter sp.]
MKEKIKWTRVIFLIGVTAFVIGTIDPLEGSIAIALGSALIALSTYKTQDRHWKIFTAALILIVFGVVFMFYFSSLGGFGGKSTLSWWWETLILPYPIGWLITVVLLISRLVKKKKLPSEAKKISPLKLP